MRIALILLLLIPGILRANQIAAEPAATQVRVLKMSNTNRQDYYVQLLHNALLKSANGRAIPIFEKSIPMVQARAFYELENGRLIDIHWAGANELREKNLRAIRIPLDRGLLGFRQFIIRRDMREQFDQIKTIEDLKNFKACQGLGWPDGRILQAAGLPVTEISRFETLFQLVVAKRCDYFPRGYFEIAAEMAQRKFKYPDLMFYESIILHYLSRYIFLLIARMKSWRSGSSLV